MRKKMQRVRHGSVYLITLVTVTAIVSMVLVGVALRQATNSDSAIVELMSENSTAPFDASEYAIAKIYDSADWITDAQKGAVFSDFTLGGRTYSSAVADADTLAVPTDTTTVYRVSVGSKLGSARTIARFDLHYERFDYLGLLDDYDLQHYWPLNERNDPADAADKHGSYEGTYTVPSVAGKGTNDEEGWVPVFASFSNGSDRIEVPHGIDFRQSQAAISMWVKWTGSTAESMYYGILGMLWDDDTPSLGLGIFNGRITAYVNDDSDVSYPGDFAFGSPFTPNTWHHVVLNWGNPGLEIYIDGGDPDVANASAQDGADTKVLGILGLGGHRQSKLLIGAGFDPISSWGMKGFNGSIAHVAMFNSPLSSSQVAVLAAQKPDEIESDIVEGSWVRVFE